MLHRAVHEWRMSLDELQRMNVAQYYCLLATKAYADGSSTQSVGDTPQINKPGDLARLVAEMKAPKTRSK